MNLLKGPESRIGPWTHSVREEQTLPKLILISQVLVHSDHWKSFPKAIRHCQCRAQSPEAALNTVSLPHLRAQSLQSAPRAPCSVTSRPQPAFCYLLTGGNRWAVYSSAWYPSQGQRFCGCPLLLVAAIPLFKSDRAWPARPDLSLFEAGFVAWAVPYALWRSGLRSPALGPAPRPRYFAVGYRGRSP
ncbi:hypothetical protein NDU88_005037 [Pleurodeles waltl]|uniref:Uncharacterized protein n=1 Tax=Pleurodeles waltl TaxID=8319 RepID=A0AAV7VIP8_PLEWA|nr:hypothetical protein NDU88_005037 [Pleurodeles waltl]